MTFQTRNDGFKVTFPNGYTVSIGTGPMHYCENHPPGSGRHTDRPRESKDAEVAVYRAESCTARYVLSNDVEGYITPLQFARLIEYVSALPGDYLSKDIIAGMDEIFEDRFDTAPQL